MRLRLSVALFGVPAFRARPAGVPGGHLDQINRLVLKEPFERTHAGKLGHLPVQPGFRFHVLSRILPGPPGGFPHGLYRQVLQHDMLEVLRQKGRDLMAEILPDFGGFPLRLGGSVLHSLPAP